MSIDSFTIKNVHFEKLTEQNPMDTSWEKEVIFYPEVGTCEKLKKEFDKSNLEPFKIYPIPDARVSVRFENLCFSPDGSNPFVSINVLLSDESFEINPEDIGLVLDYLCQIINCN